MQVAPDGSEAALQHHAAAGRGSKKARQQQQQQEAEPSTQQQQAAGLQQDERQQQQGAPDEPAAAAAVPAAPTAAPVLRTQIVVPVSSACRTLSPRLLQRFFDVRGVQAQQLLLAMVDSNGVVTRRCEMVPLFSRCCAGRLQSTWHEFGMLAIVACTPAQTFITAILTQPGLQSMPLPCSCLYNYIQAPLEGPGTANLELLDD